MPVKILTPLAAVLVVPVTGFRADEPAYPSQRITLVVPFASLLDLFGRGLVLLRFPEAEAQTVAALQQAA